MKTTNKELVSSGTRKRGYVVNLGNDIHAFILCAIKQAKKKKLTPSDAVAEVFESIAFGLAGERIYVGSGVNEFVSERDAEIYDKKIAGKYTNARLAAIYRVSERQILHILMLERERRSQGVSK